RENYNSVPVSVPMLAPESLERTIGGQNGIIECRVSTGGRGADILHQPLADIGLGTTDLWIKGPVERKPVDPVGSVHASQECFGTRDRGGNLAATHTPRLVQDQGDGGRLLDLVPDL